MRSYESPSSLNLYIECPKKYWFNYIEKPDIEEEKHLYFALGTAFHSAMEFLYGEVKKSKVPSLSEVILAFEKSWTEECAEDGMPEEEGGLTLEETRKAGIDCVTRYYETKKPFNEGIVVMMESDIDFFLEGDKYKVKCKIDRVMNSGKQKFEIHDYKTSKKPSSEADLKKDNQAALYAMALRSFSTDIKYISLIWHYVRVGMDVPFSFNEKELELFKEELSCVYRKISAGEFGMNIGNHCDWCDFRSLCPSRTHAVKIEKLPEKDLQKDDGVKLVDKLTKLDAEKKELNSKFEELEEKIEEVKNDIAAYSNKFKYAVIIGSEKQAKVVLGKELSLPGKNDEKTEELQAKVKKLKLWNELSMLDAPKLKSYIKEKKLTEAQEKELRKFAEEKETLKVTLSNKKEEKEKE